MLEKQSLFRKLMPMSSKKSINQSIGMIVWSLLQGLMSMEDEMKTGFIYVRCSAKMRNEKWLISHKKEYMVNYFRKSRFINTWHSKKYAKPSKDGIGIHSRYNMVASGNSWWSATISKTYLSPENVFFGFSIMKHVNIRLNKRLVGICRYGAGRHAVRCTSNSCPRLLCRAMHWVWTCKEQQEHTLTMPSPHHNYTIKKLKSW